MATAPFVDIMPKKRVVSGQTTVATAGTAVVVTSTAYDILVVKALAGNTGLVYVGNDGSNDVSSANGFELSAGEGVTLETNDAVYVDAAVNGEGVSWIALRRFA